MAELTLPIPNKPDFQTTSSMSAQFQVSNPYHSQGLAAGGSALLDAINKGKIHLAKFILDAGEADVVNTRDFKGKTPLIRACYIKEEKTRSRCVEVLLQRGADVNKQDDSGRTALSYACEMRCNDVVRVLVQNNVDPDIPDNKGNTALIYSAMIGNDTAVAVLVRSFRRLGLAVDQQNTDGMTALLIAAKNGFIECASLLALEGRACISFRDKEHGYTAEDWARSHGYSTKQILTLSPSVALVQHKTNPIRGGAGENSEPTIFSSSNARFYQARRSIHVSRAHDPDDPDMIPDGALPGSPLTGKMMQKRGSLPSVGSFTGDPLTAVTGPLEVRSPASNCRSRSSSSIGSTQSKRREPGCSADGSGSRTSLLSQNNARNNTVTWRQCHTVGTQTDTGSLDRAAKSSCGANSVPLLCSACQAVICPDSQLSDHPHSRTSTGTASGIKVDFRSEDTSQVSDVISLDGKSP